MSELSSVFTRELLTKFLDMSANDWRSLTCAVGTLYRTRLTHPDHTIDRVTEVFGDDVPPRDQWAVVKDRVNKLRHQAVVAALREAEANGAIPEEQTAKFRKREYQRVYMRNLRAERKKAAESQAAI
jgi:hypothetical protein